MEKHYTPDQLEKLKKRLTQYPGEAKAVEEAWPLLFKKFEKAMKEGLSPSDLKVQVLASEAQHYIDLFTGGDREIEKNMDKAYSEQQESAFRNWNVPKEVFEFAFRAKTALKKIKGE